MPYIAFSITKHCNIEIQPSSIAESTEQYFPVQVQLYRECTGKYTPSRAVGIFYSTLPVELGVYWKIQPQLSEQYGESTLPILLSKEGQFGNCNLECLYCDSSQDIGEIQPKPSENPSGFGLKISLRLRLYFIVYQSSHHNTDTIVCIKNRHFFSIGWR